MASKKHQLRLRELKSHPCIDCIAAGRDGIWPVVCMDFDHVPERGKKIAPVGDFIKREDEEGLQAELAKCDLICSNCHRLRTSLRGHSPEIRERIKQRMADPAVKERMLDGMRRGNARSETSARRSAGAKRGATEEAKKKLKATRDARGISWSETTKRSWAEASPDARKARVKAAADGRRAQVTVYRGAGLSKKT